MGFDPGHKETDGFSAGSDSTYWTIHADNKYF